ncbi:MAG: site-specific DNA-methyltransferase [Chloroflexi bacterium]|nr:site-specific DNA-methyltransferase [Chloroflexota bacterium]
MSLPLNTIKHADCLDYFSDIPDDCVDVAFADPPFNLKKKYSTYLDSLDVAQYVDWCNEWLRELVRVTKPSGSIFIHNIPKWLSYYCQVLNEIADFRHWISWEAIGTPLGKTLLPTHYGILFYAKDYSQLKFYDVRYPHHRCRKCNTLRKDYGGKKKRLHPFGPLVSDVWTDLHRIRHNKRRDRHPCQLPIPLLERIILMSTDEGDTVLDPFMGTGTTAVAAKRLGRNYMGTDIDAEYVRIATDHVSLIQPTSKVGESWVSLYLDQVATIRNDDWEDLRHYFEIPDPAPAIDNMSIVYRQGKLKAIEDAVYVEERKKPSQISLIALDTDAIEAADNWPE